MHQQGSIVRWDSARGFGFIRSASTQAEVFFHVRDFRGAPEPALRMAVEYEEIHVAGKGPRAMAVRPRETVQFAESETRSSRSDSGSHQRRRSSSTSQPSRSNSSGSGSGHSRETSHAGRTDQSGRSTHSASSASASAPRSIHRTRTGRSSRSSSSSSTPAAGTTLLLLLLPVWLLLKGWGLWSDRLPLWTVGALVAVNLLTFWTYTTDKQAAVAGTRRVSENQLHLLSLLGGWPGAWLAQQVLRHKTSKLSFRAMYWFTIAAHFAALVLWLWRGPKLLSFL